MHYHFKILFLTVATFLITGRLYSVEKDSYKFSILLGQTQMFNLAQVKNNPDRESNTQTVFFTGNFIPAPQLSLKLTAFEFYELEADIALMVIGDGHMFKLDLVPGVSFNVFDNRTNGGEGFYMAVPAGLDLALHSSSIESGDGHYDGVGEILLGLKTGVDFYWEKPELAYNLSFQTRFLGSAWRSASSAHNREWSEDYDSLDTKLYLNILLLFGVKF